MSLFSGLKGKGAETTLDASTAVMVPIVAVALADGALADEELSQIRSICTWSPIYAANSRDEDTDIILRAVRVTDDQGVEKACRAAAAALTPGLRETAFAFAARTAFSDGLLGQKEREILESLVGWLDLKADRAKMLVEVVSIMQHTKSS